MTPQGATLPLAGVENFILLNTVLSLIGFGSAAVLRASGRVRDWHPQVRARLYAAALAVPPVLTAWLVCASLLPALWLGAGRWQEEHEPAHTSHLLNAFTLPLDPALGYATFVFIALAGLAAAYIALSAYFRIGRVIHQLEIGAVPADANRINIVAQTCRQPGIAVGLVASDYPFSFVWGYLISKLVLSTGLLNALSAEELAGVLEHEAAHHARRDNLAKLALTVCRYLSPAFPLTLMLYRWWSEQAEMICDEIAVHHTRQPEELAGALVKLKRLTLAAPSWRMTATSGLLGDGRENFARRVERILSLPDELHASATGELARLCARTGIILSLLFPASLAALFLTSPLAIHTVLETLLHVF
jgi:Zn-dependent protease with chaperone function